MEAGPFELGANMKQRQQDVKPKMGLRGLLLRLAVAAAVVYLVVSLISGQLQVANKQQELDELNARVALQTEQNLEMQHLMEADEEQAYIERMVREKLGLVKPQERVYVDLTGQ